MPTKSHRKFWFCSDEQQSYLSGAGRWFDSQVDYDAPCRLGHCSSEQLSPGCRGQGAATTAARDPEDDKQLGLWLDQGISTDLSANKSLDVEFHERFDEGASNLYEYFVQGGVAFRVRPWITLIPIYRYQRFPGNPNIAYENRLQFNATLSKSWGSWQPTLRTLSRDGFPIIDLLQRAFDFAPGWNTPYRFAWRGLRYWS